MNVFNKINGLPQVFNVPIIDYSDSKVYCMGYFRKPNEDEIKRYSKLPYAMFEPAESHGWRIAIYSIDELASFIQQAKPI